MKPPVPGLATLAGLDDGRPAYDAPVLVTGVSGFLAGHIVHQLLAKGYTVHGTARDPTNAQAVGHLLALPGAAQRLRLFRADLLQPGSFLQAMQGCRCVIHTASPYILTVRPGEEERALIQPAVAGTENVLASVNATPSVARVVLTSSTAAVFTDATERGPDHVFTEADWNCSCSTTRFPYFQSKKLAEQRAYELAKEARGRWQLVSINPGAIWGPPLSSRADGESITQCMHLISGVMWPYAANIGMGVVDVRDVARAHVAAMESPDAQGRYLINARSCFLLAEAAAWLRAAYPGRLWVPPLVGPRYGVLAFGPFMGLPRDLAGAMLDKLPAIDASRAARDLGMTPDSYIPPQASVLDMAAALLDRGMVPPCRCPVVPLVCVCLLLCGAMLGAGLLLLVAALRQAWGV